MQAALKYQQLWWGDLCVLCTNPLFSLPTLPLEQSTRQVRAWEELLPETHAVVTASQNARSVTFECASRACLLDLLQCCSDSPNTVLSWSMDVFLSGKGHESEARKGSLPSGKELPSHHPTDPVELRRLNFQTPGKSCQAPSSSSSPSNTNHQPAPWVLNRVS